MSQEGLKGESGVVETQSFEKDLPDYPLHFYNPKRSVHVRDYMQ